MRGGVGLLPLCFSQVGLPGLCLITSGCLGGVIVQAANWSNRRYTENVTRNTCMGSLCDCREISVGGVFAEHMPGALLLGNCGRLQTEMYHPLEKPHAQKWGRVIRNGDSKAETANVAA